MVDTIIAKHGYMIRELHAVAPKAEDYWGAVPENLYDAHLKRCRELIDANDLTVFTPSEAVKYRITANEAKGVTITEDGDNAWKVHLDMGTVAAKYQDEISVIVTFPTSADDWDKLDVKYASKNESPRWPARKLGTRQWAVTFNPFTDDVKIGAPGTAVRGQTGVAAVSARVHSFVNGALKMDLPKGQYTATLFNAAGKVVASVAGTKSHSGEVRANMNVRDLSTGAYVLKINHSQGTLNQKVMLAH
jgi:hypothetical protein